MSCLMFPVLGSIGNLSSGQNVGGGEPGYRVMEEGIWSPIDKAELEALIAGQLAECDEDLKAIFEKYRVTPYKAKIIRYGSVEEVFIVALKGGEAMYYEDVEEGFNFSPLTADGAIREHRFEQDDLRDALHHWAG